jgi:hypothetical protein
MMLVWTPEQRAVIAALARAANTARPRPDHYLACHVGVPTSTPTYAPREIELAQEAAVRERVRRRQRLTKKLVRAIGWSTR